MEQQMKKDRQVMFKALSLDHLPTYEFLDEHYKMFKKLMGEDDYKVGVSKLGTYKGRYGKKSIYQCLSALSIFAICDYSIAIKIEAQMKRILKADGHCANSYHDNDETTVYGSGGDAVVYLTKVKDNLVRCPASKCTYVSELEFVEEHMESHEYFRDTKMQIDEFRRLGIAVSPRDLQTVVPIAYKHRTWLSTHCEHCGTNFDTGALASSHRANCLSNELRSFPCLVDGCGYSTKSLNDYQKHERKHAKDAELVAREGKYRCEVCGKAFDHSSTFRRHERTHDKAQANIYVCPRCNKGFGRKDTRDKHMRNHNACPLGDDAQP